MTTEQMDLISNVEDVSIVDRMEQAFLDYSMSVIVGRALPDVRDGLKPVQRRILYSMWESGLVPTRPYRKCASAVGDVMKKYHPHGDSSIYDALVRMGQDWSIRELLVDGHGNFGSIDGDPPAAMRYTEARLSALAMELLAGIDEDTVDFAPNYDGYETEPTVLPARFPNLLVNGATGIAVGMATNIAPHNLGEVIDACLLLVKKPDSSLAKVMEVLPAPDFPTGARIVDTDGIRDAFASGKGAITIEAVATTETRSGNLPRIVITEIPYQVNKANLLERIAKLVQERKLPAVRDLRDESSRDGMRVVVELKRGEDPGRTLALLYKNTDLRTNFNVNCVALVDGAPQTLGVLEALHHYLAHQREVLTRRTRHRLEKAEARAHVLEGLLKALDHLDEVIALIRASDSSAEAKTGLMSRFEFSDIQADAVLSMQLRKLARLERAEIEDEYQELQRLIKELRAILKDSAKLDKVLTDELKEIKRVHATPRRSRIVEDTGVLPGDDVIIDSSMDEAFEAQDVTVVVTRGGYVKPILSRRTTPAHKHSSDPVVAAIRCTTADTLLMVDAGGTGWRIELADFPVVQPRQRGTLAAQVLGTGPDEPVVGAVPIVAGTTVLTVSEQGQVKRTEAAEFESRVKSLQAAGLKGDDKLAGVMVVGDKDHVVLATSDGQITRFEAGEVRAMGRSASGVAGMNVASGARVVAVSIVADGKDEGHEVLTVGADGTAKRTPLSEYAAKGRGAKGVQTGAEPLLWAGVATDLHVHGPEPLVVRGVDLPELKRSSPGQPLGSPVAGPVAPEQGDAPT